MWRWVVLSLLVVCSGCGQHLTVRNEYITPSYLASCHVKSPDPRKCSGFCGQQLIIDWCLPRCNQPRLVLHLVFHNLAEASCAIDVRHYRGTYRYRLLNCDYQSTGGILTYRVEAFDGDCLIEDFRHNVWTELIRIDS